MSTANVTADLAAHCAIRDLLSRHTDAVNSFRAAASPEVGHVSAWTCAVRRRISTHAADT